MPTLEEIRDAITLKLGDAAYGQDQIDKWINKSLQAIAGGVLMPDGYSLSPPLPDLVASGTVTTSTTAPYVSLPDNYQRNLFYAADSADRRISPVNGGSYYSFGLFLNYSVKKDLSQTGTVQMVCVKGRRLYYQGIPSTETDLPIWYYRKPDVMIFSDDEPEGLPSHIAEDLLKHHVLKEVFGGLVEDGVDNSGVGVKYHENKFFEAMRALIISLPDEDAEPVYYGCSSGDTVDNW